MITPSTAISDAERAVSNYKHDLLVRVMAAIIRVAIQKQFVSPSDIDTDLVPKESRQGILSNSWNALHALEIIERLPLAFSYPDLGIYGGRIKNERASAKGRFTACYRLKSKALGETWLQRNGQLQRVLEPVTEDQLILV